MNTKITVLLVIMGLAIVGAGLSVFTVDEKEQALILQLGQPIGDVNQPGIHFKIPFVQDVKRFDSRILPINPNPEQMVISSSNDDPFIDAETGEPGESIVVSGEPIIVDTYARYRIIDPLDFMKTLRTVRDAENRLGSIINDATRTVLGRRTLRELLSPERTAVMEAIRRQVNQKIQDDQFGIEIVDIRIIRADLTPELRLSTVRRMISELHERATETRAKGEEKALEITSTAEKERTVLLAEAQRDAQIIRGQGDKEAIQIYADAFNRDADFYGFIRSMEAYRNTLATPDTRLILSPDSEFFRFFGAYE